VFLRTGNTRAKQKLGEEKGRNLKINTGLGGGDEISEESRRQSSDNPKTLREIKRLVPY